MDFSSNNKECISPSNQENSENAKKEKEHVFWYPNWGVCPSRFRKERSKGEKESRLISSGLSRALECCCKSSAFPVIPAESESPVGESRPAEEEKAVDGSEYSYTWLSEAEMDISDEAPTHPIHEEKRESVFKSTGLFAGRIISGECGSPARESGIPTVESRPAEKEFRNVYSRKTVDGGGCSTWLNEAEMDICDEAPIDEPSTSSNRKETPHPPTSTPTRPPTSTSTRPSTSTQTCPPTSTPTRPPISILPIHPPTPPSPDILHRVTRLIKKPYLMTFLTANITFDDVASEYRRFITFVENLPEPGKSELSSIRYPIFIYFYLLLLQPTVSGPEGREMFFDEHSALFHGEAKTNLEKLWLFESYEAASNDAYFRNFLEMKYIFRRSTLVFQNMRSFLERNESIALWSILQLYFHEECTDAGSFVKNLSGSVDKERAALMAPLIIENIVISEIVIKSNERFTSVDFNSAENTSEVSFANGSQYIFTSDIITEKDLEKESPTSLENRIKRLKLSKNENQGSLKKIQVDKPVFALKYNPNNTNEVLFTSGETVGLVDIQTGYIHKTKFNTAHSNAIVSIDVDETGSLFVTGSEDCSACLWSFAEIFPLAKFIQHTDVVCVVKFHPFSTYIATGSGDTSVRLWSKNHNRCVRLFEGHQSKICCIAFSPEGSMIASADMFGLIEVFNIEEGSNIFEVLCYHNPTLDMKLKVTGLCFNHDSSILAACNYTGIFKAWVVMYPEHTMEKRFKSTPIFMRRNDSSATIWDVLFCVDPT